MNVKEFVASRNGDVTKVHLAMHKPKVGNPFPVLEFETNIPLTDNEGNEIKGSTGLAKMQRVFLAAGPSLKVSTPEEFLAVVQADNAKLSVTLNGKDGNQLTHPTVFRGADNDYYQKIDW